MKAGILTEILRTQGSLLLITDQFCLNIHTHLFYRDRKVIYKN